MKPALPLIVLQKSQNALRLICRKKTKQVTIADQCVLKRATEAACEFTASWPGPGSLSCCECDPRGFQSCGSRDSNGLSPQAKDRSVHSGMTGVVGRWAQAASGNAATDQNHELAPPQVAVPRA